MGILPTTNADYEINTFDYTFSPTTNVPTSAAAGDLLIWFVAYRSSAVAMTYPAGWETLWNGVGGAYQTINCGIRIATDSEPTSYTGSLPTDHRGHSSMFYIDAGTHSVSSKADMLWDTDGNGVNPTVSGIPNIPPALFMLVYSMTTNFGDYTGLDVTPVSDLSENYGPQFFKNTLGGSTRGNHVWWERADSVPPSSESISNEGSLSTGAYTRSGLLYIPGVIPPANNPSSFTYGRMFTSSRDRAETLGQFTRREKSGLPPRHRPPRSWT